MSKYTKFWQVFIVQDGERCNSRRDFLQGSAALVATSACGSFASACAASRQPSPPEDLDVTQALTRIRRGELSAEHYTQSWIERIHAASTLNAFITVDAAQALESARRADRQRRTGQTLGPLHGLPLVLKDVINTAGVRTTYATKRLRDHVPQHNAAIVDTLLAAGALVLAKTNCDELNFGSSSQDSAFGGVRNPFDLRCIPGGSSGGSAAAVGGGVVPLAFGADTSGSIRMPAALCGAKGFRPTTGRYSTRGVWPISPTLDAVGPIARSVADLATIDHVLLPNQPPQAPVSLQGLRIGIMHHHYFSTIDDHEVVAKVQRVLDALTAAGAILVRADFAKPELLAPFAVAYPILFAQAKAAMTAFLAEQGLKLTLHDVYTGLTPNVKKYFDELVLPDPSPFDLQKLMQDRDELKTHFAAYFAQHNVSLLLFPATPFRAPQIGQRAIAFDRKQAPPMDVIENSTAAGAAAGQPGLTLPIGQPHQHPHTLPVAIELAAPPHCDRLLLSAGMAMEKLLADLD